LRARATIVTLRIRPPGCQWKALPKDLPPKSTAHYYFMLWDWDGTLERIHHAFYVAAREQAGR
jgi:transposase